MTGPVTCSYGGGVQSTAVLVLAAQRRLSVATFLFANTGDDSEDPGPSTMYDRCGAVREGPRQRPRHVIADPGESW